MKTVLGLINDTAPGSVQNSVGDLHVPSNRQAVKKNRVPRGSLHVKWRNHPVGVLPNDIRSQPALSRWSPRLRVNGTRTLQSRILLVKERHASPARCRINFRFPNNVRMQLEAS